MLHFAEEALHAVALGLLALQAGDVLQTAERGGESIDAYAWYLGAWEGG